MVKKLYEKGYLIGVATLKAEKFAEIMLRELEIRKWFNTVCGMDEHDDLDKADLNYDKYFKDGDVERNTLTEFDSNNTELLSVEQVKEKLLTLQYIRDELAEWENR